MDNAHYPPGSPSPSETHQAAERWAHLIQQSSLCGRQLRRLLAQHIVRWNISDTEFLVLWACNQALEKGLAQNELASMLGVSAAQMSGLAYDLRDRTLVSFERNERDRRVQVLRISGMGRMLLTDILADLEPVVAKFGQFIGEAEQRAAEQMFDHLTRAATEGLQLPTSETTHGRSAESLSANPPLRKAS